MPTCERLWLSLTLVDVVGVTIGPLLDASERQIADLPLQLFRPEALQCDHQMLNGYAHRERLWQDEDAGHEKSPPDAIKGESDHRLEV
jgi:hypothetical protein